MDLGKDKLIINVDHNIEGDKYFIKCRDCDEKCPNNPDFDQSIKFAQFCPKCYNEISKKHKPVIKPLQLDVNCTFNTIINK